MSLISPNFDVLSRSFFPILARGLFPKLLGKALEYHEISTLINFLNKKFEYVTHSFFIHLGIANVNWVFNISNKYLFGDFGFLNWVFL